MGAVTKLVSPAGFRELAAATTADRSYIAAWVILMIPLQFKAKLRTSPPRAAAGHLTSLNGMSRSLNGISDWLADEVSLTIDKWAALPEVGAPSLLPHVVPRENADLSVSFPTFIAPAAQVLGFLNPAGASPPHLTPKVSGRIPGQLFGVNPGLPLEPANARDETKEGNKPVRRFKFSRERLRAELTGCFNRY